jgi:hypothetical protein
MALLLITATGLGTTAAAADATLSAEATRSSISINDQLSVTFRLRGGNQNSEPDFSPLQQDFDILYRSRSQKTSIVNGHYDAYYQWELTLAPKRRGDLTIPSIEVGGAQSEPIAITVTKAPDNPAQAGEDLFMTVEPDKRSVYVQEQVLITAKIFSRQNFEAQEIQDFNLDQALIEAVAEDKYVTDINGTPYAVYEVRFALYPQKSGTLQIPAINYAVRLRSSRRSMLSFGGGDVRRGRSSPLSIQVKPIPAANGSGPWLPASSLSISQHFSHDTQALVAGEPITRSITVKAEGLHPSQLPPLTPADLEGFSTYADKPQKQEQRSDKGLSSERTDTIAMVPNSGGKRSLPPVEVKWFNTTKNTFEVARLPAVETHTSMPINSNSSVGSATPPVAATDASEPAPVQRPTQGKTLAFWCLVISQGITLLLLMVVTTLYWRARHQRLTAPPPAARATDQGEEWRAIKKAAAQDNLAQLRRSLMQWAEVHFSRPIKQLEDIALYSPLDERESLLQQLRQLDKALYHPDHSHSFDKSQLLPLIQALRVQKREASNTHLASLYPQ